MTEMHVGRRIREAREAMGLTQQEVAKLVGMTQRAVSYVEKQKWVKQSTLEKYGNVLGRQLAYFLRPYDEQTQATGLSREEAVQQAFLVVCRDADFGFGNRSGEQLSQETKVDIIRLYERYKGVSLLPLAFSEEPIPPEQDPPQDLALSGAKFFSMKAWFLLGPEQLELRDLPDPVPGSEEAVVRVGAVGLCGSDLEAFAGAHPLPNYPRLPGHEFAGEVVAVGADWGGLPLGTRVAVDPALSCGLCYACRQGRHNCCAEVSIAGVHRPGAMAEYVVCRAGQLVPIPDSMTFGTAAMVETLSIGAQATARPEIGEGDKVVILGAGSIGLCCLMMAKLRGAEVLVSEPLMWRRARAAELGADVCVEPGALAGAVREFTGGYGAHVVMDATGEVEAAEEAFALVGSAGRVVILTLSAEPIRVKPWQLVRQELTVFGSRLTRADFGELVELAASGRAPLEKLVTHRYPMAGVEQAYRDASARVEGLVKAVVLPQE